MAQSTENLDAFLADMTTMENFGRLIPVTRYYHIDWCEKDCEYCLFFQRLVLIYSELKSRKNENAERLRLYCIMQEKTFIKLRCYINRLAACERKRIELEKEFTAVLSKWNGIEEDMKSSYFEFYHQ